MFKRPYCSRGYAGTQDKLLRFFAEIPLISLHSDCINCRYRPFRQSAHKKTRRKRYDACDELSNPNQQPQNCKPNRSPEKRVRFGKEGQRHERALTFAKSQSKGYKAWPDAVTRRGYLRAKCRRFTAVALYPQRARRTRKAAKLPTAAQRNAAATAVSPLRGSHPTPGAKKSTAKRCW